MGKAPSNLLVCVVESVGHIKIIGRANFASSISLKMLVKELRERGFKSFVLDLTECITMDSTFLGVLAGLVLKLEESQSESDHHISLELHNPNARVTDLLENLGVSHLFKTLQDGRPDEAPFEPSAQGEMCPTREEISETCLEAHETLMKVNPHNIPRFKDVAQFLAEDLKKLKG